ncbi:RNA polymerase rbp2 [Pandoravirus neocaledonia]|uniref:DNA-directed RNA polymerase subunit beta n=1 Tax=Pandoravirus neocaledonia TaxID=2107708 RepID=A0A2U7UBR3_9VIRU|nr:RNA polymerase rbp2 [Pandoravirus neocaledonia]AVK75908.1 RNA polymerase rbp2 [Pandoravirus neocaledonia]
MDNNDCNTIVGADDHTWTHEDDAERRGGEASWSPDDDLKMPEAYRYRLDAPGDADDVQIDDHQGDRKGKQKMDEDDDGSGEEGGYENGRGYGPFNDASDTAPCDAPYDDAVRGDGDVSVDSNDNDDCDRRTRRRRQRQQKRQRCDTHTRDPKALDGYGNPHRHPEAIVAETRPQVEAAGAPAHWHYERFVNATVVDPDALAGLVAEVDRPTRLALAAALVHARGLTRHQVDGFDKFMDVYMPAIVAENNRVVVDSEPARRRFVLEFGAVTVHRPSVREADGVVRPVYPRECRMRGLVYACTVTCDLLYTVFDITGITKERLKERGGDCTGLPLCRTERSKEAVLCQIPCMVGSRYCRLRGSPYLAGECPLERPGAFIVRGSAKMLVSQIKMRINHACVMAGRPNSKYSHVCEIRPRHESKIRSTSTLYVYLAAARPHVEVRMPFVEANVPVADVFRLLGVTAREDMVAAVMDHMCALDPESDARLERAVRAVFDQDDHAGWSRQALCEWLGSVGTRGGTGRDGTGEPAQRPTAREERVRFVEHIMGNEFLPHVGLDRTRETYLRKAHHLGYCVHRLLAVSLGRLPMDDRDHMALKRIDTAAVLLPTLFRPLFRSLCKGAGTYMRRRATHSLPIEVENILDYRRVTAMLRYALMTGNWTVQKGAASASTGVAQMHNRMTVTSALSNMRRVNTPINKEGRLPKVRQLRDSVAGLLCPVETPEGASCGLVSNLALAAHVRVGHDRDHAVACVRRAAAFVDRRALGGGSDDDDGTTAATTTGAIDDDDGRERCNRGDRDGGDDDDGVGLVPILGATRTQRRTLTQVQVNGVPEGYARDGTALAAALRDMRRAFALPFDASIVHRPALRLLELHVDTGCCVRPLLRVDGLHRVRPLVARFGCGAPPEALFHQLLVEGAIEYLSKDEEETCRVASDPADLIDPTQQRAGVRARDGAPVDREPFTHVEVHPLLMLGACAAIIPFSNHNQAPRNIYQTAMGKQSKAVVSLNADHAIDTVSHALCYPQVPLVQTAMEDVIGATRLPMGQNVRIAIMSDPYDQEDSLVLKRDFVDRGGFRSVIKRTYRDDEKTRGADATRFCRPQDEGCHGMRKADYTKLGPGGFVEPGTRVLPGDVLVGKVCNTDEVRDPDAAVAPGASGSGGGSGAAARIVKRDKSTILRTDEPATVHRVVVTRNGDGANAVKIVTRAMRGPEWGDKLSSRHGQKGTVGYVRGSHDMPWSPRGGGTPDVVINPHCIPSRMTMGKMMEALLGKVACREGYIGDGTPFGGVTVEDIAAELARHGCERYGKEVLYHPHTGEPIEALIFTAPVYYQALRHVAIDKIHARPRGPVQMLTKQPVEGRSRSGGFRLGEMERDCIISHGASQFLLERLFEQSDAYSTVVCAACGLLAIPAKPKNAPVVGMVVRGYDEAYCRVCETGAHVREVKMPYACKLLVQELMACCVAFRFRFDPPNATAAVGGTAPSSSQCAQPIAQNNGIIEPDDLRCGDVRHDDRGRDDYYNDDDDDQNGETNAQGDSCGTAPRMEGAGPGGSVLAALPAPALDGILGRIETLLKAAAPDGHKRKRDHDNADN